MAAENLLIFVAVVDIEQDLGDLMMGVVLWSVIYNEPK